MCLLHFVLLALASLLFIDFFLMFANCFSFSSAFCVAFLWPFLCVCVTVKIVLNYDSFVWLTEKLQTRPLKYNNNCDGKADKEKGYEGTVGQYKTGSYLFMCLMGCFFIMCYK